MSVRLLIGILITIQSGLMMSVSLNGTDPQDSVHSEIRTNTSIDSLADTTSGSNIPNDIIKNLQDNYFRISNIYISENHKITHLQEIDENILNLSPDLDYLKIDFDTAGITDSLVRNVLYTLIKRNRKIIEENNIYTDCIILSGIRPGKYKLYLTYLGTGNKILYYTDILSIRIKGSFWAGRTSFMFYGLAALLFLFFFTRFQTQAIRRISRQFRERDKFANMLMKQKEELSVKNKNITDSINYAKRIQSAMMPPEKFFKTLFPQSFILHIAKDIVSGDFYWINEVDNIIFIAAVDCTGHGVPGAFMSIIGFELFRKLTNVQKIKHPSEVLNNLNFDFQSIFRDIENINLRDGMDLAFCAVDKKKRILEFSGAFNPLYLLRNNSIIEIKADRYSIGLEPTDTEKFDFTNHMVKLEKDDVFYIFSDGYVDQFGGPEGKKYKYRRFRHLLLALHKLPIETQHHLLNKSIMEWKGDLEQVDDILVIGIKVDF